MDNFKWTIRRNWQHREYKTQDEDKQNKKKNNMCWTPLFKNKQNVSRTTGAKDEPNIVL